MVKAVGLMAHCFFVHKTDGPQKKICGLALPF